MKKGGRYDVSSLVEAQYEPGSDGQVLKNLFGIKSRRKMEEVETRELYRATDQLTEIYDRDHRFTAADICQMHQIWLGSIYEWAGRYRQVIISKGGFTFAMPKFIPKLMDEFEKEILGHYTPCTFTIREEQVAALAVVHTELTLIHPFREGNGRVARLLANLMALQAGLPLLDFADFQDKRKEEYFAAVRAGLDRDYQPMKKVFNEVISETLRAYDDLT